MERRLAALARKVTKSHIVRSGKVPGLTFAAMFGVVGVFLLASAWAAVPSISIEAEAGTPKDGATVIADASASGGQAIRFDAPPTSQTAASVTQYGITWTFDKAYPVGKFANGDWWVVGPVKIASMSPAFSGTRNGWEANPSSGSQSGLDSRIEGFKASLVPSLPYVAAPGKSILKAVSRAEGGCGNDDPCLTTAAILTVLDAVPPANGQNTFRPPFFGTAKPLLSTTQLKTNILPSKAPVANAPTLARIARRYQRPQVDYISGWSGRYMHPLQNYAFEDNPPKEGVSEYGSEIGIDADDAALRLMLNDPLATKMPALINYVQAGIDMYGMHRGGVAWNPDGGHMFGRKLPAVFAAVLLDDATMKSEIANAAYGSYGDDGQVYTTTNAKTVAAMQAAGYKPALFGKPCGSGQYETEQQTDNGPRDCRDPIGMIDGGEAPGDSYQFCCSTQPMKGASLAARLLPGGKATWNYQPLHDYIDRWVGFGAWASPDDWNSLGKTPARNYSARHGTAKNDGWYASPFVGSMWNAYRSSAE